MWLWFFSGLPNGFRTALNFLLFLGTTKTSYFWFCLWDSYSIQRQVIRLSIENSFILWWSKFLKYFQPRGSLSIITIIWNCSSEGIHLGMISWENLLKFMTLILHWHLIYHLMLHVATTNIFLCSSLFSIILLYQSLPYLFCSLATTLIIIKIIIKSIKNMVFLERQSFSFDCVIYFMSCK